MLLIKISVLNLKEKNNNSTAWVFLLSNCSQALTN